ncbi:hypothetical protein I6F21_21185 [Bradyrhizobium sp. NBAIM03]|uniref:hypothetical protein n=1 Tax=Bradyrhizobium TaxID=374 RepID=UPI001CD1DE23|nr:hypothetical protein [Bradyrhizobium sp. NBAIM03]MCA1535048.1 hypothetical protein [Bradyrhizobium sp. NBAIM03]
MTDAENPGSEEYPGVSEQRKFSNAAIYRLGPRTLVSLERGQISNFTDPVTNQISFGRIELREFLKLKSPGDLPLSVQGLRFFLHEVTHHGSFASHVGNARAALATSVCARASIGIPPSDGSELWLGQRDDIVLRFFEMTIEPLVEGLALFAEHDAQWASGPIASHTMLHLWSLFLFQKSSEGLLASLQSCDNDGSLIERAKKAHDVRINEYLKGSRTQEYWVEQKVRLLRQPLLGNSGPPYLLGYLAAKRAYLVLRKANPGFSATDIFLLVMNGYWFSDIEIADLLLRIDDRNIIDVQNTIGAYMERFQDMWDDLYRRPAKNARHVIEGLGNQKRRTGSVAQFELMAGLRTAADSLNFFVPKFLKHRLILRLGMIRVNIVANEGTRLASVTDSKTGGELLTCPLTELSDTGEFPGSVELVRTYDGSKTAIVVLGMTGLVAVKPIFGDQWNDPDLVSLFDDLPSLELIEASAQAYTESPFASGWDAGDLHVVNDLIMGQARDLTVSTYLQIALPGQQLKQRTNVAKRLEVSGFAGLFPDSAELDDLAMLSLHFGGSGESFDVIASKIQCTVQSLARRLTKFNERSQQLLGIDVFEIEEGRATAAI